MKNITHCSIREIVDYAPPLPVSAYSNGMVLWAFPALLKSTCKLDVDFFPWDQQTCELEFGSWTYDMFQVSLHLTNNRNCYYWPGNSILLVRTPEVCPNICVYYVFCMVHMLYVLVLVVISHWMFFHDDSGCCIYVPVRLGWKRMSPVKYLSYIAIVVTLIDFNWQHT